MPRVEAGPQDGGNAEGPPPALASPETACVEGSLATLEGATVEGSPAAVDGAVARRTALLKSAFAKRAQWQVRGEDVICPNDVLMRLHREHSTPEGNTWLSFRAPPKVCAVCPKKSGCTKVSTPSFVKEVTVTLPEKVSPSPRGRAARRPAMSSVAPAIVVRAAISATPILPTVVVGLLSCVHPTLVVAGLRRAFEALCTRVRVAIELAPERTAIAIAKPHIAKDAAHRQHRRTTVAQHLAWNAADPRRTSKIEFIGGDLLKPLLTPEPSTPRHAA